MELVSHISWQAAQIPILDALPLFAVYSTIEAAYSIWGAKQDPPVGWNRPWGGLMPQREEINAAVCDAIIANDGTITHHHALGRDHRPRYATQRIDVLGRLLGPAKTELDAGVMNPGVLR